MAHIPVGINKFAVVDDCDYETVSQYRWHYKDGQAVTRDERGEHWTMQRVILGFPKWTRSCVHINGNELDNRRSNLLTANLVGKRFGRLTVIEDLGRREQGRRWWLCLCDCGNRKDVRQDMLLGKKGRRTRSCGCRSPWLAKIFPEEDFSNPYRAVSRYVSGARARNIAWDLCYDDAVSLLKGDCFYCGTSPSRVTNDGPGEQFVSNGIDRLDSNKGYSLENCVTCCTDCNFFKRDRTVREFLEKILLIYRTRLAPLLPGEDVAEVAQRLAWFFDEVERRPGMADEPTGDEAAQLDAWAERDPHLARWRAYNVQPDYMRDGYIGD